MIRSTPSGLVACREVYIFVKFKFAVIPQGSIRYVFAGMIRSLYVFPT